MYIILLLVCLSAEPQCTEFQEDPVNYYFTEKQCQNQLNVTMNNLVDFFTKEKYSGEMQGKCAYVDGIKEA
jgi:hypothetical protein